jgi:hypothetical protein
MVFKKVLRALGFKKKIGRQHHVKSLHTLGRTDNETVKKMGRMADASYSQRGTRPNKIGEHYLVGQHGDERRATYFNPKTRKWVLSLRGTNPKSIKDLGADAFLALGGLKATRRYKKDDKFVKSFVDKYGKDNVSLVGHSLAARLASDLGKKHELTAYTFNEGRGLGDLFKSDNNPNIHRYRTKGDIVSLAGKIGGTRYKEFKPSSFLGAHGISNFT